MGPMSTEGAITPSIPPTGGESPHTRDGDTVNLTLENRMAEPMTMISYIDSKEAF